MSPRETIACYRLYAAHCLEIAQRLPDRGGKIALLTDLDRSGRPDRQRRGRDAWHLTSAVRWAITEGVTAMNAAETHDFLAVLLSLQALEGMGREIGRGHPIDEDLGVHAIDAGRTGLVRKMLRRLSRR